jgi:hypothetical protein
MDNAITNTHDRRLGWPWAADVTWAVVCLIVGILFVLAWANVPA